MFKKWLKNKIAEYLSDISMDYCIENSLCTNCPFGTKDCECTINHVIRVLREVE